VDSRGCWWARTGLLFHDGYAVRTLTAPFSALQVFVADNEGRCLYAGSAGRGNVAAIQRALHALTDVYADQLA
jgi:hypothetical protein